MPAKLEIEIIDRGTPTQAGGAAPVPVPAQPGQPAPVPPGQSQFPPGSVGDVAQRWQQTGAMNTATGNTGPAAPVVVEAQQEAQQETTGSQQPSRDVPRLEVERQAETAPREVERQAGDQMGSGPRDRWRRTNAINEGAPEEVVPELTGRTVRQGWQRGQAERPQWEQQAEKEFAAFNDPEGAEKAQEKEDKSARAADRIFWQMTMGKLGGVAAAQDKAQEVGEDPNASASQKMLAKLGVAQAYSGALGSGADTLSSGVRGAGGVAASIVQNDPAVIQRVTDAFEGLARKVPIVGEALGGVVGLLLSPAKALADVFGAMTARGKELSAYSGEIAQATAMQEVKLLMADIREANENGGEYARLIEIETEFQIQYREFMMPIKKFLLEYMVAFLEWARGILQGITGAAQAVGNGIEYVGDQINTATGGLLDRMAQSNLNLMNWLPQIEKNTRPAPDPQATLANLYDVLGGARGADVRQQADLPAVGQGVGGRGAPIVGGP